MKKEKLTVATPSAYIAVNKQRIKQYENNVVYLENQQEFQIELFNPLTSKVLAKIELNGVAIGSGIVLRPGERVFLERYLDKAKKFLFETYTVNGNNEEVKKAIEKNGSLEVKFYQENISQYLQSFPSPTIGLYNIPNNYYGTCNLSSYNTLSNSYNPIIGNTSTSNMFYNSGTLTTATMDNLSSAQTKSPLRQASLAEPKKAIETGRIEAGSHSNQEFSYDSTKFYTWSSWSSSWKILPISQKAVVKEDLTVYCTECGTKRKKDSFKFCPQCGAKF